MIVPRVLAAMLLSASLGGCASPTTGVGYYWQSVTGHLQLMRAARPVQTWIEDEQTPAALKTRLATAQRIRDFAARELALPDNASYRRYADLQRRAAVYNVVAAPALELTLNNWCFPVVGCVGYRGYYSEADARAFADSLPRELDVAIYPVPAYSTLGWMNWAGGDPLLNTFIGYPEGELARIVFHELAHQVVYAKNDTMFNESFATAVERLGGARTRRWTTRPNFGRKWRPCRSFVRNTKPPGNAGAATPATTPGSHAPTTRCSPRRPPTTNWCPDSRRCSNAREATSRGFTMRFAR